MKCPDCRWYLEFLPYRAVYIYSTLDLWEAVCRNRNCIRGRRLEIFQRVVRPLEAVT